MKNLFTPSCKIGHNIFSSSAAPGAQIHTHWDAQCVGEEQQGQRNVLGAVIADNLPREYSTPSTPPLWVSDKVELLIHIFIHRSAITL